jgi:hypothetical protein
MSTHMYKVQPNKIYGHLTKYILSLFSIVPTSEHRASIKLFVSLQFLNPKTIGRTRWTRNHPVARPLPTQDNTNSEQRQTDIHALSRIRTHNPSVRASEHSSCGRPRGHCDRQLNRLVTEMSPHL